MPISNLLKQLIITFDYELFLGKKSGSIDKCVIVPTEKILNILSRHNAHAIFFVDMAWLLRLKEVALSYPNAKKDYDKVVMQIQNIVKAGHYVFNHLHPHWLDAKYNKDTNQWELDNLTRYRFSVLDKASKDNLVIQTTQLLNEIVHSAKPGYIANGYRAGGWSIQPFEDFKPYFLQNGIKYDFSVMPGMKSITSAQQYDFSGLTATGPYTFSDDPAKPSKGEFIEFPINHISIPPIRGFLNKILLKCLWKTGDRYSGDGQSTTAETINESVSIGEMISVELLTKVKLPLYLSYLKQNTYMHFISHPKMLSVHNINTFTRFMEKAFGSYNVETDFMKIL